MTFEIIFVAGVLLATLGVIGQRWLSVDVALMAALAVVTVGGVLEPREAVAGFASTAIVAIGSLYILAAAAGRVGLLDETLRPWGIPAPDGAGDTSPETAHVTVFAAIAGSLIVLPIAGVLPFATTALFAAVAVVVSGLLSPAEARGAVDWKIIIAIGASLGLAQAVTAAGAVGAVESAMLHVGPVIHMIAAAAIGTALAGLCTSRPPRRLVASGVPLAFAIMLHFSGGVGF